MGNAGSGLKSKSNAEIDEIFTKFDKDGSGAISSDELQVALSELFNVQMSSSQRGALMAAADTNADGILQKSEFVDFAKTYEGSLPGSLQFGEPGIQFVSFSSDAPIGLTLSTNEETKMPRVDATEGPAAEAGVPIGSSIKYLHDQTVAPDTEIEAINEKISELKQSQSALTIGFVVDGGAAAAVADAPAGAPAAAVSGEAEAPPPPALTEEETAKYKEAFANYDRDGSGAMDAREINAALIECGYKPSEDEVASLLAEADVNHDGVVQFDEFVAMVVKIKAKSPVFGYLYGYLCTFEGGAAMPVAPKEAEVPPPPPDGAFVEAPADAPAPADEAAPPPENEAVAPEAVAPAVDAQPSDDLDAPAPVEEVNSDAPDSAPHPIETPEEKKSGFCC